MKTKKVIKLLQTECTNNPDIQKYVKTKIAIFLDKPKRISKIDVVEELCRNDFGMIVPEVEQFANKIIKMI